MAKQNKPQQAPDTGHEWDGIRELTNPIPRWWMICFHAGWIWCIIYFVLYPSIPLVHESTKGILGWTQIKEFKEAVAENDAIKAPYLKKVAAMDGEALLADAGMRNFAESSAKAIFGDNCAACHGAGGEGAGSMPAHKGMIDDADIQKLADFVLASSQGKATAKGLALFNESGCADCHGADAKGGAINELGTGAANLTDGIWRFGGSREAILRTINNGVNEDPEDVPNTRTAMMPAFGEKLSPEAIKMLAVKVHEFGGGK